MKNFYALGVLFFYIAVGASLVQARSGDLDFSFGQNGKTITDFFGRTDVLKNMLIDQSGRILVSGSATKNATSDHFALARYEQNGNLDQNFGTRGKVTTRVIAEGKIVNDGIFGLGLQSDGKIVACGRGVFNHISGLALLRYTSDGVLDSSFGDGGFSFTPDTKQENLPLELIIDENDKIIVAAAAFEPGYEDSSFAILRYNKDGSLDQNFGQNGLVTTKIAPGTDVPRAVKIDKTQRIVAAGFNGNHKFVVVRYQKNGLLDASFGDQGISTIHFNDGTDTLHALAIQNDGKIVVGGDVQVGSFAGLRMVDFGLARLTADGHLDLSFNGTGKQTTYFVQKAASTLWALAVQNDGKIVAVGDASIVSGLGLARYNNDGSLDQSFGQEGKQILPFSRTCHFEAISLGQEGKIIAGGYVFNGKHYDIALARFEQ